MKRRIKAILVISAFCMTVPGYAGTGDSGCSHLGETPDEILFKGVAFFPGYKAQKVDSSETRTGVELEKARAEVKNCIQKAIRDGAAVDQELAIWDSSAHLLHLTTKRGDLEMTKILLDNGADANAIDPRLHETPLSNAVLSDDFAITEAVLGKSDPVRMKDQLIGQGLKPLHFAALRGNPEVIELLVRFGFDSNEIVRANPYAKFFEGADSIITAGMAPLDIAIARLKFLENSLASAAGDKRKTLELQIIRQKRAVALLRSSGARTASELAIVSAEKALGLDALSVQLPDDQDGSGSKAVTEARSGKREQSVPSSGVVGDPARASKAK